MKKTVKFILMIAFVSKVFAGIGEDLENFFNKTRTMSLNDGKCNNTRST